MNISLKWLVPGLLLWASCKSALSEGPVTDLTAIGAEIHVYQSLTDQQDNTISVSLFDKDHNAIGNPNLKIKVDTTALDYVERRGLYYTTSYYYVKSDIPVKDKYNLQLTLTNGTTCFLGSIKPIAENDKSNIVYEEKGDLNKDLIISWHDLKEIDTITVQKSVLLKTSTATESNYEYEPEVVRPIQGNGRYVVSRSEYVNARSTISILEVKFTTTKSGTVNDQLLEGSTIKISGVIDFGIPFKEQK